MGKRKPSHGFASTSLPLTLFSNVLRDSAKVPSPSSSPRSTARHWAKEISMPWYVYLAHFFGGVFLANSLPHLIAGVSGHPLQTPFASPPFRGLSSPLVNVAWALTNLALA